MEHSQSLAILEAFADGASGPREIADRAGIGLADLGRWLSDAADRRTVEARLCLSRMGAALLLCRYRALAAPALAHIASQQPASDLTRKACADLLGADLPWPARGSARWKLGGSEAAPEAPAATSPPSEDAILRALEALGHEAGA